MSKIADSLRLKWTLWRCRRAVRRRKVATRERKRLEQKYEHRQMNLRETIYELCRLVFYQSKQKVLP